MLGRRSYERFSLVPPVEGTLRIFQDVILNRGEDGELVAYGREPGIVGELLAVDDAQSHGSASLVVRVVESRPVIVQGSVRHRLRLKPAEASDT